MEIKEAVMELIETLQYEISEIEISEIYARDCKECEECEIKPMVESIHERFDDIEKSVNNLISIIGFYCEHVNKFYTWEEIDNIYAEFEKVSNKEAAGNERMFCDFIEHITGKKFYCDSCKYCNDRKKHECYDRYCSDYDYKIENEIKSITEYYVTVLDEGRKRAEKR